MRTAQDRSRYIGTPQVAPTSNRPGLAIGGEIDEAAYRALVEKLGGLRAIVLPATTGRTVVLHGLPVQLPTLLGILGWDGTPGLVSDDSPSGRPTDRRIG